MNQPKTAIPIDPTAAANLVASDRWQQKICRESGTGCEIWTGTTNPDGYGHARFAGRAVKAHRVAFVAATGRDIPAGLVIDHLCRNRACTNPDHLRAVTPRENVLAPGSLALPADLAQRSHCPQGHELAGENLVPSAMARGQRNCLICHSDRRALFRDARTALGLTQRQYVSAYGWKIATAEAILAAHGRATEPAF